MPGIFSSVHGSGPWLLISKTTVPVGSGQVNITIPDSNTIYKVFISYALKSGAANIMQMRVNNLNAANYFASYHYHGNNGGVATHAHARLIGQTQIDIEVNPGNATAITSEILIDPYYGGSGFTHILIRSLSRITSNDFYSAEIAGAYGASIVLTQINLFPDGNTWGGKVWLFGLQK